MAEGGWPAKHAKAAKNPEAAKAEDREWQVRRQKMGRSGRAPAHGAQKQEQGGGIDGRGGAGDGGGMSTPLTAKKIAAELKKLPGWAWEHDALAKTFEFANFRDALAFMVRAGFEAEALNHHPEWMNVYKTVAVRLCTHDADGKVTALDVELARRMDKVAG